MVGGSGGKSRSKNQSQSTSESGTRFNKSFLDELNDYFGADPSDDPQNQPKFVPARYDDVPHYERANYTGANYTPVEGGDFDRLERNLYEGSASKLTRAYNDALSRQNEEIAQMGGLNS